MNNIYMIFLMILTLGSIMFFELSRQKFTRSSMAIAMEEPESGIKKPNRRPPNSGIRRHWDDEDESFLKRKKKNGITNKCIDWNSPDVLSMTVGEFEEFYSF